MFSHWADLQQEEQQLVEREAQALAREARLVADELAAQRVTQALEASIDDVAAKAAALAGQGVAEARALIEALPKIVPPPGVLERMRAIRSREQCLEARELAASARAKAVGALNAGVVKGDGELGVLRTRLQALEAQVRARSAAVVTKPKAIVPAPSTAPTSTGHERRSTPRAPVHCEVTFESESNFYSGFSQDLSQGGVFLATFDLLPMGSTVEVALALPGGINVRAHGVVRWLRPQSDLNPQLWPGMGIEFVDLPPAAQAAIGGFVAQRAPWFFVE